LENNYIEENLGKQPSVSIEFHLNKEKKSNEINRREAFEVFECSLNKNENYTSI